MITRQCVPEASFNSVSDVLPSRVPTRSQVSVLTRFTSPSLAQVMKKSPQGKESLTFCFLCLFGIRHTRQFSVLMEDPSKARAIVVEFDEGERPCKH